VGDSLGPVEGGSGLVVRFDESVDYLAQLSDGGATEIPQRLAAQETEPYLDHIQRLESRYEPTFPF
jgi:hypothetical protein